MMIILFCFNICSDFLPNFLTCRCGFNLSKKDYGPLARVGGVKRVKRGLPGGVFGGFWGWGGCLKRGVWEGGWGTSVHRSRRLIGGPCENGTDLSNY